MSEIIDRVSRALFEQNKQTFPGVDQDEVFDELRPDQVEYGQGMARAAIEALRKPTVLQLASGWEAVNKGRDRPVDMAPGPALREAYMAMIDEALK